MTLKLNDTKVFIRSSFRIIAYDVIAPRSNSCLSSLPDLLNISFMYKSVQQVYHYVYWEFLFSITFLLLALSWFARIYAIQLWETSPTLRFQGVCGCLLGFRFLARLSTSSRAHPSGFSAFTCAFNK